jgi:hypothetical protein
VDEVIYLPGSSPDRAMVELRLVHNSSTTQVRLGPTGFLKQHQFGIREGDAITITGYRVSAGDDLLVATEITKEGKILRLRDSRGRPVW